MTGNKASTEGSDSAGAGFSVLRVATYPTVDRNGMGLPAYMLAADSRYSTVYRAPRPRPGEVPLEAPREQVELRFVPFPDRTMPEDRRASLKTVTAASRRIGAVTVLSARIVLDRRARGADLVHIHSPMYAAVAAYAKLRRTPTVITIHGTDFVRLRESAMLRKLLTPVDRILCVSDRFAHELAELFPSKRVEPVYNGVDTEMFSPSAATGRRHQIITVGSLRWHKDHLSLIKAFVPLAADHPDWALVIVGDGELRSDLERAVEALGLRGRVRLAGTLSHVELARELAASEVFALSSVTEGLPKALLEAMASGCACVATDVGECRAVIGDAGLVVGPGDPNSLSGALASLVSSPKDRVMYQGRAVARASEFTWAAYRDRHYVIYRSMLGLA